jgi:hypothetical protein
MLYQGPTCFLCGAKGTHGFTILNKYSIMSQNSMYQGLGRNYNEYLRLFLQGVPLGELETEFEIGFREFYCVFSNLFPCSDIYELIFHIYENQLLEPTDIRLQSLEEISLLAENLSKVPFKIFSKKSSEMIDVFIELCQLGTEIKNLCSRNERLEYINRVKF